MSDHVAALEAVCGAASAAGFGSAVFHGRLAPDEELARAAFETYRGFVGPLWERFGADAWTGPWKEIYARPSGSRAGLVAELKGLEGPDASSSASMVVDAGAAAAPP